MESFVPCADEVWRLQHLDDPDCVHFRTFCDDGDGGRLNGRDPSETRQGTYCATPSGILLGKINTRDPRRMAAMLRSALERFEDLSRAERLLDSDPRETAQRIERAENEYPEDGLVLRVDSRDLPRGGDAGDREGATDEGEDWRVDAFNFDYAWFSRAELERTVPRELEVGGRFELPAELAARFARLHLVDNVRGQTNHYDRGQVRAARVDFEVVAVEDGVATLRLGGAVHLEDDGRVRGIRARATGRATFDTARRRFTAFELLVVGERRGATRYNQRHDDVDVAPIGFAVHLPGEGPTERVAPTAFWEYGWR